MDEGRTRGVELAANPTFRRAVLDTAAVAASIALGLLIASFSYRTIQIGPVTMTTRLAFGWPGETSLRVPPFGEAHAQTHVGPARLIASVESVDVPGVERILTRRSSAPPENAEGLRSQAASAVVTVSDVIKQETRSSGERVASLALLASLVAAAVTAFAGWAFRRRAHVVAIGVAASLAIVLGSVGVAAATYDPSQLAAPHLEGALAYVPRLQTLLSTRLSRIEELRTQVAGVADELAAYYADPRSIAAGGGLPGTFRVLHVGDLHMDPVGAEFERSLVRSYEASLVIDTGDIAILGSAEEASVLGSLVVTSTSVLFVPGNHDSAIIDRRLSQFGNITVLSTGTVEFEGLRIFAVPDPMGTTPEYRPDNEMLGNAADEARRILEENAEAGLPRPDIIATHNPRFERRLIGLAPLVLSGHTHTERLYRTDGTYRLNSGTLGGMPYDPVITGRARLPHSASVLYYTSGLPRKLIAIDRISVGVDGTTRLDRTVVEQSLLP